MTIGERVHLLRLDRHWTRAKLEELSGVTAMTIYSLETQRHVPSYTTLERVSAAFGMTIDKLYEGVGEADES